MLKMPQTIIIFVRVWASNVFARLSTKFDLLAGIESIVNESWANNIHIIQYAIYICFFSSSSYFFSTSLHFFVSLRFHLAASCELWGFRTKAYDCCMTVPPTKKRTINAKTWYYLQWTVHRYYNYSNDHVSLITRLKTLLCSRHRICVLYLSHYHDWLSRRNEIMFDFNTWGSFKSHVSHSSTVYCSPFTFNFKRISILFLLFHSHNQNRHSSK